MPGATDQAQAARFDAIVKKLIGEGRGTIPQGARFHTVETQRDNSQAFADRARWCSDAILTLGTGGKLTVTTEANSGTLAGNAHQESFERLCAASARSISECINRQFCRRILREAFPDSPQLAAFSLSPEKEDDRASQAQIIATLSSAGFRPSAETVSELIGFEVQAVAPSQPATPFSPGFPPITNSASDSEPNSDMVQNCRRLQGSLDKSAAFARRANSREAAVSHRPWSMVHASDSEQEEPVENSECRSPKGPPGCSNPDHNPNLRAAHKGGRASKGNRTGKKNTPTVIQPGDSERVKKQKLTKAFDEARRDKKVHTGLTAGKKGEVILAPGDIRHGGTHHADRPEHGEKISSQKLAETLLHGEKENDRGKDVSLRGKGGLKMVLTPEPEFPTMSPEQKHPENPKGNMKTKNWVREK